MRTTPTVPRQVRQRPQRLSSVTIADQPLASHQMSPLARLSSSPLLLTSLPRATLASSLAASQLRPMQPLACQQQRHSHRWHHAQQPRCDQSLTDLS
jgi:hypothetical protein